MLDNNKVVFKNINIASASYIPELLSCWFSNVPLTSYTVQSNEYLYLLNMKIVFYEKWKCIFLLLFCSINFVFFHIIFCYFWLLTIRRTYVPRFFV